jgi:phosphoglycerate dehydrogenase-like enzyme
MRVVISRLLAPIIDDLPQCDFTIWDFNDPHPLPESILSETEVYVPTYMSPSAAVAVASQMPSLRMIQLLSAGVDATLPLIPHGVTLCNAKGVHDASTAELAVGLALAAKRQIPTFVRNALHHKWQSFATSSLADSHVLIVGYGSVGEALEARLLPFEVTIERVARSPRAHVHGVEALPQLLPKADIVFVVVPLTDETHGLVDRQFLHMMKTGSLLVNIARGPVVDTNALVEALQSGAVSAALDVTDPEPLPADSPLWDLPNCLISPHVGGNTSAFLPRVTRLVRENLTRYASGAPLLNVITGSY